MLNIRKISLDNKSDLEFMEKLYIESFPPNERRSVLKMHHLINENERFNVCILVDDNAVRIGLMSYWVFDTFVFLEHFAIDPLHRNGGCGQKAIYALINEISLPLVGEIELPSSSEFAARRLNFYERLNFRAWNIPYEQPPYEEDHDAIPMLLLTYGALDLKNEYEIVKNQLYTDVYEVASV